ncbi:MAG: hypothetical protein WCK26_00465 [Candidatus Saccharibacteria bacterium]
MQSIGATIRKRTLITKTNRMMFLWVAGVSIVLGISVVAVIFLTQMLLFNEKVLTEKNRTIEILKNNNDNIADLKKEVRLLDTNQALIDSKAKSDDKAIQVILDALPSDANSLALGASLQNRLLAGIDGLTLDSIQVDPVIGVESFSSNGSTEGNTSSSGGSNEITFRFSVHGSVAVLQQVLRNLEVSIRTIDVISLKIESQASLTSMTISGRAFYEPQRVVELKDKVIKQ